MRKVHARHRSTGSNRSGISKKAGKQRRLSQQSTFTLSGAGVPRAPSAATFTTAPAGTLNLNRGAQKAAAG